jgi:hypothetical protein
MNKVLAKKTKKLFLKKFATIEKMEKHNETKGFR